MTTIRSCGQPSATARSRSAYCRLVLSVFSSTWRKVLWRMYRYAWRWRCVASIFDLVVHLESHDVDLLWHPRAISASKYTTSFPKPSGGFPFSWSCMDLRRRRHQRRPRLHPIWKAGRQEQSEAARRDHGQLAGGLRTQRLGRERQFVGGLNDGHGRRWAPFFRRRSSAHSTLRRWTLRPNSTSTN
jgi:hypothetical protein